MTKYYLAYGSNLNVEQMRWRCPTAKIVGTAEIKGFELRFRGSLTGSYLTIEKQLGRVVPVAVWAVSAADVKALDRYEGYPNFYYKADFRLAVALNSGETKTLDCFAYIMHEDRPLGLPTKGYAQTCLEGYEDFGFDKKILLDSITKTKNILWEQMK